MTPARLPRVRGSSRLPYEAPVCRVGLKGALSSSLPNRVAVTRRGAPVHPKSRARPSPAAIPAHACPSQRLRSRLAQIAGGRTVAVPAARDATVTRLNALARAVNRDIARLRHRGVIINRTEIDTPGDRFLVTLDPSSVPRSRAIIRARYGLRGLAFTRPAPPARAADARNDTAHARSHTPRTRAHASPSRAAAAPFLIQAHALAQGDFVLACAPVRQRLSASRRPGAQSRTGTPGVRQGAAI